MRPTASHSAGLRAPRFRGFTAAASLKPQETAARRAVSAMGFRGFTAAASLKREAGDLDAGMAGRTGFRGFTAAASLKRLGALPELSARILRVSAASPPRPH